MKIPLEERLPALLAEKREALGLSQTELAERVGCHQTAISHWETGNGARTLARVMRLFATLKLRPHDVA